MARLLKMAGAVALALLGAGCLESTTLISVNPDGSGTIVQQGYLSPQMTGMMQGGMGAMMGGMPGAQSTQPPPKVDLAAELRKSAERMADQLGEGVTMVSFKEKANKAGWKGFSAKYAFDDINKVRLSPGGMDAGDPAAGGQMSTKSQGSYTFAFTPGDVANLKVIPEKPADGGKSGAKTEQMPGGDQMGEQMIAMLAPMLQGMRIRVYLMAGSEIVETNAEHRSESRKNLLTLVDLPVDKVLNNPEAMKMAMSQDPASQAKLAKMDIPGVIMESPDKTIEISFK